MSDANEGNGMFMPAALQDMTSEQDAAKDEGGSDEEATTMSLAGITRGDSLPEADLDLQSMEGGGKLLNQGTMIIAAIVVVAAGSLYFMRMTQRDLDDQLPPGVREEIQSWINGAENPELLPQDDLRTPGGLRSVIATNDIIAEFTKDPTAKQVPIEDVKKNPFELYRKPEIKEDGTVAVKPDDAEQKRQARLKVLRSEMKRLNVSSIMASSRRKIAVINNEFYKEGMALGSFTIAKITPDSVTLVVSDEILKPEERKFMIKMDDGVDTSGMNSPFKQ